MTDNYRNFALQFLISRETERMQRMEADRFWNLREPVIDQWFYNPDGTLTGAAFHYAFYSKALRTFVYVMVDMYRRTVEGHTFDPYDSHTCRLFEGERLNLLDYLADIVWFD